MDTSTGETRPRLVKAGATLTAALTADPSLTAIEVGEALGFLLADSCHESMMGAKLHLETVLWVRCEKGTGVRERVLKRKKLQLRPLDQVDLYRHEEGVFVAQDASSLQYLRFPSRDPYHVMFLTKEQHDQLRRQVEQRSVEQVLESIGTVVQEEHQFGFDGEWMTAPASYATAADAQLEHGLAAI